MITPRVIVCNQSGYALAEVELDVESVLWRLGQTGTAKLSASYRNSKVTPTDFRPGNRLLIQFEGLPDWGGVLDFPISRKSDGISFSAFEGDRLLAWRQSGANVNFGSTAPGAIAQALIVAANTMRPTGITIGNVYQGGAQTRDYHYAELGAAIRELRDESEYDYAVIPTLHGGRLWLDFYWYERRGTDRRATVGLVEGHNVGRVTLDEQGPVYNVVRVVGPGEGWGASRPVATAQDIASINLYGWRETTEIRLDVSDEDTLQEIADAILAETAYPRVRGSLNEVRDAEPGRWAAYHVGDIVTLDALPMAGEWRYSGPVRILSRQWQRGLCALEVEEWRT